MNHPTIKAIPRPRQKMLQQQAYYPAFELAEKIETGLRLGIRHYRDRQGKLLRTLDQVIRAILDDNLDMGDER